MLGRYCLCMYLLCSRWYECSICCQKEECLIADLAWRGISPTMMTIMMPTVSHLFREKLNRGVSKPGGFPLFRERSRLCRGLFRDCSSQVFLMGREREKGRFGKFPGPSPSKSGKSRKNRESPKKDKKGRTSPDRETLFEPPPPFSGAWLLLSVSARSSFKVDGSS